MAAHKKYPNNFDQTRCRSGGQLDGHHNLKC